MTFIHKLTVLFFGRKDQCRMMYLKHDNVWVYCQLNHDHKGGHRDLNGQWDDWAQQRLGSSND